MKKDNIDKSRRDFLKNLKIAGITGVACGAALFLGASGNNINADEAKTLAYGHCGGSHECAGGGGMCGGSHECAGGGGMCGGSHNCAGS